MEQIIKNVRANTPLVHCMTNYVTVNDCANILLACGGSPIMADAAEEVAEITNICAALVINIGTLNTRTVESMRIAGKAANAAGHPVILDPVGAGASRLRTESALMLMEQVQFSVIRGNVSEIRALALGDGKTCGVDANAADAVTEENLDAMIEFAKGYSRSTGAVIAITGAIDLVADAERAYVIRNGCPQMGKITGTGCMLSAVTGGYCGANPQRILEATAAAVCAMGICGERAWERAERAGGGTGTMRTCLIDAMSQMDADMWKDGMKVEVR